MPEEDHGDVEYDLVMPFVVCASQGGPFDDGAYVAGYEMGRLDADFEVAAAVFERTIRTDNVPQAELLAMKHEWQMESRPDPIYASEWSLVRFAPLQQFDGGGGDAEDS